MIWSWPNSKPDALVCDDMVMCTCDSDVDAMSGSILADLSIAVSIV